MELKSQENNPYLHIMIKNFNTYVHFYRPNHSNKFITWKLSRERACKLMYSLSRVYEFKQKSSLWHRRAIKCRYKLEKVKYKYNNKWNDRFFVLGESKVNVSYETEKPSLFDISGHYMTSKLNSYVRDYKNLKQKSKNWDGTFYRIKRSIPVNNTPLIKDGWLTCFRRSFREFNHYDDIWNLKFQSLVKYWNNER